MDPLLFGIKSDVVFEVFGAIVLLSIIVERGLALIFDHRLFVGFFKGKGLKEFIAFGFSYLVVSYLDFDALAVIFSQSTQGEVGYLATAGVIAGGSKGSMAVFQDWLNWRSSAAKAMDDTV